MYACPPDIHIEVNYLEKSEVPLIFNDAEIQKKRPLYSLSLIPFALNLNEVAKLFIFFFCGFLNSKQEGFLGTN